MGSCGSWSSTARTTVSPPTPLSKIPIGASFMASRAYDMTGAPSVLDRSTGDECPEPRVLGDDAVSVDAQVRLERPRLVAEAVIDPDVPLALWSGLYGRARDDVYHVQVGR